MRAFEPLFENPHFQSIAGTLWPRRLDVRHYPVTRRVFRISRTVSIWTQVQGPGGRESPRLVLVHGLEGSGESGYMRSMTAAALERGYSVHRFHMRTCGDAAPPSDTFYHAGLTSDLRAYIESIAGESEHPVSLAGFSLGGNVVLKLLGEWSQSAQGVIGAAAAISTPIDLAACARRIGEPQNRFYENRFLFSMRRRLARLRPDLAQTARRIESLYEFDDRFTAPSFGFRGADHYYQTQSSLRFLPFVATPVLVLQADDDQFIPSTLFHAPSLAANPHIQLARMRYGGHVGFLARRRPRFWLDGAVLDWLPAAQDGRADRAGGGAELSGHTFRSAGRATESSPRN